MWAVIKRVSRWADQRMHVSYFLMRGLHLCDKCNDYECYRTDRLGRAWLTATDN